MCGAIIKVRYKQTAIGIAWVVLQPLLTMAIFSTILRTTGPLPSQDLPYPIFYFAALVPWTYFSGALQNATNIVVENQRVITKVYFPRLILPVSAVLSGLVDFAIGFVVLVGMTLGYGMHPDVAALWLPVILLLSHHHCAGRRVVAFGAERALSRCAVHYAVRRPVLDVRFTGRLSEQSRSGALALALRAQPHGRRH